MGRTRVNVLAGALGLERTTLTRVGMVLERNGWVRTVQSDDARERPLELTRAGRGKLVRAFPAWKAAQDVVSRRIRVPRDEGATLPLTGRSPGARRNGRRRAG